MSFKGYVQVYTGNGKGKTTAAIGLSIRALGAGMRVMFLQFMKSTVYSEHNILPDISPNFTLETVGKPYFIATEGSISSEELAKLGDEVVVFPAGNPPGDYLELIAGGMSRAKQAVNSGDYDLVVLDEVNVALFFGLVKWEDLLEVIDGKPNSVELLLTGRGAPPELIKRADLVTEMKEIKHYYTKGVEFRTGIDG
ncbi:MAG: cob(I)alamin adenosyltransferase [Desulforhopalus sp.]|jgi:cob(I)alamin adenosyltransferase